MTKGQVAMKTVLVTNGQQRKTLAAVRSLGGKGITVLVSEETRCNPSAFSKFCSKFILSPNARKEPIQYYKWLCSTIIEEKCDVLIAMDDDVLEIVIKHYEELSQICTIPVPSMQSYFTANDKGKSVMHVQASGVPCPKTVEIKELEELNHLPSDMTYPVVIKPRKSSGSRGIRIVNSQQELVTRYLEVHKQYPFPIIQEYIGLGERYDVCMLYDKNHQLKAYFIQKEIRHFPIDIGPSTVQQSVEYPELLVMAKKIMEDLPWYGVVELEFMVDSRDGKLKFMEINSRFWASLQMAIDSGVDFPYLLYKLAVEEEVHNQFDYKVGGMCRWLLPGDILHFIFNQDRRNMKPPFISNKKQDMKDDIISKEDLIPVFGFILACFRYLLDFNMWKFIFKR